MSNDAGDGFECERAHLRSLTTISGTFKTARAFEKTIDTFYHGYSDRLSKPMRVLVREPADAVSRHCRLFAARRSRSDVAVHMRDRIEWQVVDHKVHDFMQLPELRENPDDGSPRQSALSRETVAAEEYAARASTAPEGALRDHFRFLANEELDHEAEPLKRCYKLAHRGGV